MAFNVLYTAAVVTIHRCISRKNVFDSILAASLASGVAAPRWAPSVPRTRRTAVGPRDSPWEGSTQAARSRQAGSGPVSTLVARHSKLINYSLAPPPKLARCKLADRARFACCLPRGCTDVPPPCGASEARQVPVVARQRHWQGRLPAAIPISV